MRIAGFVLVLAASAVGQPIPWPSPATASLVGLESRGTGTGNTASELENGACRPYTLIFARATVEGGNMGGTVGPALCDSLKSLFGKDNVACQGVGKPYTASIGDNLLPKGTSAAAIGQATSLFQLAATKCPTTKIIASGYSQGGAVMHGSISALAEDVKSRIVAAIMFGDSRNAQDKGQIPNFPKSKTKIFCKLGDLVCLGTDLLSVQHFLYTGDVGAAVGFFKGLLN